MSKVEQLIEYLLLASVVMLTVMLAYAILEATDPRIRCCTSEDGTKVHLPTICQEYYNSGTDEWVKCMRVEAK